MYVHTSVSRFHSTHAKLTHVLHVLKSIGKAKPAASEVERFRPYSAELVLAADENASKAALLSDIQHIPFVVQPHRGDKPDDEQDGGDKQE